jgi:hypothetical protein
LEADNSGSYLPSSRDHAQDVGLASPSPQSILPPIASSKATLMSAMLGSCYPHVVALNRTITANLLI